MSNVLIGLNEEEDEKLLSQINIIDRLFAIPLNAALNRPEQMIVDRALKEGWLRFIDVRPNQQPGGMAFARVFYLTDQGLARLSEIRNRKKIQVKLNG